jgi:uncharacterized protein (TIGR00255 family)
MSVYSMTGYGSAASSGDSDTQVAPSVSVEVRSVNGRFLDVTIKISDDARGLEAALRELVASRVKRGKVELRVAAARETEGAWQGISPEMLLRLARMESSVQGFLPKATPLSVHEALQWCRQAQPATTRTDEATLEVARRALDAMIDSRHREGERLATSLRTQLLRLRELAARAQPLVGTVVQRQQQRFLERWREALAATGGADVNPTSAQERALSEAATYALRIDVAEELTRLKAHFDELDALLDKGGELGKRLDFLVQELHREANTLGAKSQSIELTAISMDMRVTIEQMREQVQNIE